MEPQQFDAHADDAVIDASKPDDGEAPQLPDGEFDAEHFASLLKQNQLIAYTVSWDPLMKALEALAASMGRQQQMQRGTNSAMDKMRERLDRADQQKQELAATVSQLQDQVGALSTELQTAKHEQDAQRDELQKLRENQTDASSMASDEASRAAFASSDELQKVKKTLSNQLRKSLSAVFGDQFVVHDGDEDDEESNPSSDTLVVEAEADGYFEDGASVSRPPSRPGTGVSGVLRTPLPGVPFASEVVVNAELAKLREQQAALEAKLATQKDTVESLDDKLGSMDARLDAAAALQQRRNSTPAAASGPSTEALQRQLDELKTQQAALLQQLRDQATTFDKQASGFKELAATLDDMATQQKMFSARSDGASGGGGSDTTGPPQLDLSLVFAKIADLRRATDATIDQIQQSVREAADSTTTQQGQLDALRHAAVFNEQQKLRLMEARLALQKELLDRNQTHQDRAKPSLAEWKKQLEQMDDKLLVQGMCDPDTLVELQQLQRNYHRTMLTMTPLIHSPLMIAESLQQLADEVKDLQSGMQSGVLTVVLGGPNGDQSHARVDEFATKLRYLDEEIAATQQVNVVTEKKNDPLLKSLDTMRDKLENLSSLWHQNLLKKKRATDSSPSGTPRSDQAMMSSSASEVLRDMELRLMGAVRRLGSLEEDVDRLGALMHGQQQQGGGAPGTTAEDVAKLRKELQAEIHRLSNALAGLQASVPTPLVPTAPPGRSSNASSPARGDLVGDLHAQMVKRKELDGRLHDDGDESGSPGQQRTHTYDALLKDLTKKVTQAVLQHADKSGASGGGGLARPAGIGANPNVNFRALLENFTQKFDDRLDDTREFTLEELAKLRRELLDLVKARLEAALRDLRNEFLQVYYPTNASGEPTNGDSTAVGTKPVMCVACSRPVPVSGVVRDYPSAEMIAEQTHALLHAELEYDRNDDDFVYRAGFKMPADRFVLWLFSGRDASTDPLTTHRKTMTLPFLANNIRSRIALNKIDRKPRRPARQQHPQGNPVDSVVREVSLSLDTTGG
jgi:hypothetical protein